MRLRVFFRAQRTAETWYSPIAKYICATFADCISGRIFPMILSFSSMITLRTMFKRENKSASRCTSKKSPPYADLGCADLRILAFMRRAKACVLADEVVD